MRQCRDDDNLTDLQQEVISHNDIGSTVSAGTVSISGRFMYFTPNRQTNYDTYTLTTKGLGTNADYVLGA